LLSVYASEQMQFATTMREARSREDQALGSAGPERITAVTRFLSGYLGDQAVALIGDGQRNPGVLWTSNIVKAFEALITKVTSGHGSSYSQSGRDGGPRSGPTEEQYAGWTSAQRLNYARTGDKDRAA
jgi:hypothetical protein